MCCYLLWMTGLFLASCVVPRLVVLVLLQWKNSLGGGIFNHSATRLHLILSGIHEHPPAPSATLPTPRASHRAVFEDVAQRGRGE